MAAVSEKAKAGYRELLQLRRKGKSAEPIPNRYPWHGEMAIRELLEFARSAQQQGHPADIRILTGSAPDRVYGCEDRSVWDQFAKAGGRIRIIVWGDNPGKCGGVLRALYETNESVEFRLSGTNELAGQLMHFVVVGNSAYRLEAPHTPFPDDTIFQDFSPEIPARICFNDPIGGEAMVRCFDSMWGLSRPLNRVVPGTIGSPATAVSTNARG